MVITTLVAVRRSAPSSHTSSPPVSSPLLPFSCQERREGQEVLALSVDTHTHQDQLVGGGTVGGVKLQ